MTLAATALCLSCSAANADFRHFPGPASAAATLDTQQRVEALYEARDYRRALLIYEKQLADNGDKYAQYMVGYMTLTGRGREADAALALAWYRLAAERGARPYVQARDLLRARLDEAQLARADAAYGELLPRYGDRRLLLDLVGDDLRFLRAEAAGGGLQSGFLGGRTVDHGRLARQRVRERLDYLEELPAVPELAAAERELRAAAAALLN